MRVLVSVRSAHEAMAARGGGADFIDLKEPRRGALGGLDRETICDIVATLRRSGSTLPVSATIGDVPMARAADIVAKVSDVAACGVDYVKVGIERDAGAAPLIDALAALPYPIVPVFIVDDGLDRALVERACGHRFPAVMVDTAAKRSGTLFDFVPHGDLGRFIDTVRRAGALAGVAGALRACDAGRLVELAPDFAGFRSAVCSGDRSGDLDVERLRALRRRVDDAACVGAAARGRMHSAAVTVGN